MLPGPAGAIDAAYMIRPSMDAHPEASHSDIVDAVAGKSRRWPRLFLAALVVGTVVRLASLTLPGTADMGVWKLWTYGGAVEAPARLYGIGGSPTEDRQERVHAPTPGEDPS